MLFRFKAWVVPESASIYHGSIYVFCQENCKVEFQVDYKVEEMEETEILQHKGQEECDTCGLLVNGEPDQKQRVAG